MLKSIIFVLLFSSFNNDPITTPPKSYYSDYVLEYVG